MIIIKDKLPICIQVLGNSQSNDNEIHISSLFVKIVYYKNTQKIACEEKRNIFPTLGVL